MIWLVAAIVPLAVRAAWTAFVTSPAPSLADCGNPLSPIALLRAAEATVVLGSVAAVALLLRSDRASLALCWPSRPIVALSLAAPVVLVPAVLVVGPMLTGPFFGPVPIEVGIPAALIPAAILAASNAGMEEVLFRGAVLGWGAKALGPTGALVLQAVLFGVLHAGGDFLNPIAALPVLAAVFVGGLIAGVIVQRTGWLLLPFAVHFALDVPLYYAFACRLPG